MVGMFERVAVSARSLMGGRALAMLWQHREGSDVEALRFGDGARAMMGGTVRAEDARVDLAHVSGRNAMSLRHVASRALGDVEWSRCVVIPLAPGNGSGAALVHQPENPDEIDWEAMDALAGVWAMAIGASAQHDGARRLAEDLARANTDLQRATEAMARVRSLAHLSEVAAGAAHEMNNPLTVISGHAQLLLRESESQRERASATAVIEAAHRLSELIADLHFFASPPNPAAHEVSVSDVVMGAISASLRIAGERARVAGVEPSDSTIVPEIASSVGTILMDPDQIGVAVTEVVLNAIQSEPSERVVVRVHRDPVERRLVIAVEDDGVGMGEHTVAHAFDPFFSARTAGRRSGLGLARARRLVELHGGTITIHSEAGVGTEVRIELPEAGSRVGVSGRSAA